MPIRRLFRRFCSRRSAFVGSSSVMGHYDTGTDVGNVPKEGMRAVTFDGIV